MTRDEAKATVIALFDLGEDKWFDYDDEFMKLIQLIENETLEKAAVACENLWEEEVYRSALYAAAAIRGMKT
jgi:hypothetical protein